MLRETGAPTGLTCPDCGGALWQVDAEGEVVHYGCHVGHRFTEEALDAGQRHAIEEALWSAVRVLEEHADLRMRMAERASHAGLNVVAGSFAESAHHSHAHARRLRDVLLDPRRTRATESAHTSKASTKGPARASRRRGGR